MSFLKHLLNFFTIYFLNNISIYIMPQLDKILFFDFFFFFFFFNNFLFFLWLNLFFYRFLDKTYLKNFYLNYRHCFGIFKRYVFKVRYKFFKLNVIFNNLGFFEYFKYIYIIFDLISQLQICLKSLFFFCISI